MKHAKLILLGMGFVLMSFFVVVGFAGAQQVKTGETATVSPDETVDSMLFAAGNSVDIAGTVNGDVYCAGQTVTISGTINGDIICAGQTITVNGNVNGSVRLAAQTITISSQVSRSATVATQTLVIESEGAVKQDVLGGAGNVTVNGLIGRDLAAGATSVVVNGAINRNIKGEIERLTVNSNGRVGGGVEYVSANEPTVNEGGEIAGTVTRTTPTDKSGMNYGVPIAATLGWIVYMVVSLLVFAVALALLMPRILHNSSAIAIQRPSKTVLAGLATAIVAPILIVALFVSVIGIPLALFVLLVWTLVAFLSGPFAAYSLGRVILKDNDKPLLIMLLGASVLLLLYFVPILGFFVMIAAYLFGVGMIVLETSQRLPKPEYRLVNEKSTPRRK